jgi:ClpX C4-type zinc finger
MRRPGTDENNVQMSDVLCDFCGSSWSDQRPMVEGHQGGCVCGSCLSLAYREVVIAEANLAPTGYRCILCLEARTDPAWASPMREGVHLCKRCIKQSAAVLAKDPDYGWKRPT